MRETRTNTPLQALTLLNETTFVEAARVLAQRVLLEETVRRSSGYRQCSCDCSVERQVPRETAVLERSLARHLERYRAHPAAAEELLSVGEAPRDAAPRHVRTGGLCRGGQPGVQSRRSGDQGVAPWILASNDMQQMNRRLFLSRSAGGAGHGGAGLAVARRRVGRHQRLACRRRIGRPAALHAQGQAGDLPVPVRRALADGLVRLQAEPATTPAARNFPTRCGAASGSRR